MALQGILSLGLIVFLAVQVFGSSNSDSTNPNNQNEPAAVRVITEQELAAARGEHDGDAVWLSLAGQVYDVTSGRQFYGPGGPYHVFAGRDAPVPYVTGIFTDDEAHKSWRTLSTEQVGELHHWLSFYAKSSSEKYPLLGVLHGQFYDAKGQPTAEHAEFHAAVQQAVEAKTKKPKPPPPPSTTKTEL
ncbi:hypothetical protein ACA910_019519 [Epithemia clementina (nom. ined.)]